MFCSIKKFFDNVKDKKQKKKDFFRLYDFYGGKPYTRKKLCGGDYDAHPFFGEPFWLGPKPPTKKQEEEWEEQQARNNRARELAYKESGYEPEF